MKHSLINALCFISLLTCSQGADVFSFEDGFQAKYKTSAGMTVSVSDKQAVLGKKSLHLKWSADGGSITIPVTIKTRNQLIEKRKHADDIIIVKNGLVTDSFYANLAFLKNGIWFTPETPLLLGVQRQFLLSQKTIQPNI